MDFFLYTQSIRAKQRLNENYFFFFLSSWPRCLRGTNATALLQSHTLLYSRASEICVLNINHSLSPFFHPQIMKLRVPLTIGRLCYPRIDGDRSRARFIRHQPIGACKLRGKWEFGVTPASSEFHHHFLPPCQSPDLPLALSYVPPPSLNPGTHVGITGPLTAIKLGPPPPAQPPPPTTPPVRV